MKNRFEVYICGQGEFVVEDHLTGLEMCKTSNFEWHKANGDWIEKEDAFEDAILIADLLNKWNEENEHESNSDTKTP